MSLSDLAIHRIHMACGDPDELEIVVRDIEENNSKYTTEDLALIMRQLFEETQSYG